MQKLDGLSKLLCRTSNIDLCRFEKVISIFHDSEVTSKFTFGKTKRAYFMNYGVAPHFKNTLTKARTESPFYRLLFE